MDTEELVAFLPAWLVPAMEEIPQNTVLFQATTYFLCPGPAEADHHRERIKELAAAFTPEQREVVGDFLRAVLDQPEEWEWHHPMAKVGLTYWEA